MPAHGPLFGWKWPDFPASFGPPTANAGAAVIDRASTESTPAMSLRLRVMRCLSFRLLKDELSFTGGVPPAGRGAVTGERRTGGNGQSQHCWTAAKLALHGPSCVGAPPAQEPWIEDRQAPGLVLPEPSALPCCLE